MRGITRTDKRQQATSSFKGAVATLPERIDDTEIVHTVRERPAPMIPGTSGLLTPN